ncbi:MAG: radical SAM protein [Candidatus Omnitrophica bacterium]|nr:radical SAM protein [Candidatus Omnitrophota bacterium]
MDALAFPDFDGFPLEKYMTREMSILFNRGCPRKCAYCSLPGTTPTYRSRSAQSIYEEIKHQIKKYPYIDSFHDDSPALNSNLKELSGLCDLIIQDGLKIRWSGFASINKHMDVILLKKMKEAGCSGLNFGIESGSQKIVDKMRKGFRIEDAADNLRDAYNLGIETVANFIIGFPGEEEEDFQQTLEFISSNKQYISYVGSSASCWIGPYIWLYEHSEEFGIIPDQNFSGWSCKEVNDQIRNERGLRFKKLLDSLEIGKSYPQLSEKK